VRAVANGNNTSTFYIVERIRDLEDDMKEKVKALESKVGALKFVVYVNTVATIINTVLLYLIYTALVAHGAGHAANAIATGHVAQGQQIAVVK